MSRRLLECMRVTKDDLQRAHVLQIAPLASKFAEQALAQLTDLENRIDALERVARSNDIPVL